MTGSANQKTSEWCSDVWDIYVPHEWPLDFPTMGSRDWDLWIRDAECSGKWEVQDPFPPHISRIWDDLVATRAPLLYWNLCSELRLKLLIEWEKRFASSVVRLKTIENDMINPVRRPEEKAPSTDHFVGLGEFGRIECWRRSDCGHPKHPQAGCEYSARSVDPVPPKINMNYWLAKIEDGDRQFQAVLEAPLRVDLGSPGPVYICWSQQILQFFLRGSARMLDRHWHNLPKIIARAQIEGHLFRASR